MFTKRNFPIKMSLPKNMPFMVGLGYTDVLEKTMLKFNIYFQDQSVITMFIEKETLGLFDFSPEEATSFILVDGPKFFETISKTNVYKGFELEIEKKCARIIYQDKSVVLPALDDSFPNRNYSKVILPDHTLENAECLQELSGLSQIHKSGKDPRMNALISNAHITVGTDSIQFWATYGGVWHVISCPFNKSENIIDSIEGSWNLSSNWFKWISLISTSFQHVSIRNDSGNKTYLCLDDTKSQNQILIRLFKDDWEINYPNVPETFSDKQRACNSLKLSERDRKMIRKNSELQFYRVCPEVWL